MKQLLVPFLSEEAAGKMQAGNGGFCVHELDQAPWKEFPYRPRVKFGVAHSGTQLFLKYEVDEQSLRCENTQINGAVWEDSCVEFFIGFDESGYYNLEFNCIGTPSVGFGAGKEARTPLPLSVVERLRCTAHSRPNPEGGFHWELAVQVPVAVFSFHAIHRLNGLQARGNFYKCGDRTPTPHFLCWNGIDWPTPNFHLPQFFGNLHFEA